MHTKQGAIELRPLNGLKSDVTFSCVLWQSVQCQAPPEDFGCLACVFHCCKPLSFTHTWITLIGMRILELELPASINVTWRWPFGAANQTRDIFVRLFDLKWGALLRWWMSATGVVHKEGELGQLRGKSQQTNPKQIPAQQCNSSCAGYAVSRRGISADGGPLAVHLNLHKCPAVKPEKTALSTSPCQIDTWKIFEWGQMCIFPLKCEQSSLMNL